MLCSWFIKEEESIASPSTAICIKLLDRFNPIPFLMALSLGRSSDSILDPFFDFSIFAPALASDQSRQFAKDVSAVANTRVDWVETPEAHVFKADLPGLSKEEIKISVDDSRTLQISGERKKEEVEEKDRYHRVERVHGSFLRRFRLPQNANLDAIKAEVANGVLTVSVPKVVDKPKPQPRSITVE